MPMKKRTKVVLIALVLVVVPLWVLGDPPIYFAKASRGQVVDDGTGQPLEGVVLVAEWRLYSMGIGSGGRGGALNTLEAVTDMDGKYQIAGWGPRLRPFFAYLDQQDPELVVFKSGYYPQLLANPFLGAGRNRNVVRSSDWDGKVIRLRKFDGNVTDYWESLDSIWAVGTGHCLQTCPRLVIALDAESRRLKAIAPKNAFVSTIVNIDDLASEDREFLRRFQHERTR
jgi:hypothetical protein